MRGSQRGNSRASGGDRDPIAARSRPAAVIDCRSRNSQFAILFCFCTQPDSNGRTAGGPAHFSRPREWDWSVLHPHTMVIRSALLLSKQTAELVVFAGRAGCPLSFFHTVTCAIRLCGAICAVGSVHCTVVSVLCSMLYTFAHECRRGNRLPNTELLLHQVG